MKGPERRSGRMGKVIRQLFGASDTALAAEPAAGTGESAASSAPGKDGGRDPRDDIWSAQTTARGSQQGFPEIDSSAAFNEETDEVEMAEHTGGKGAGGSLTGSITDGGLGGALTGSLTDAQATASFNSTATDFDHLTCPGAQAEMDAGYLRAVFGAGYNGGLPHPAPVLAGMPSSSEGMWPPPYAIDEAMYWNYYGLGLNMLPGLEQIQPPAVPGAPSVADLSAHAAKLEFAAQQLRIAAQQAEEAARVAAMGEGMQQAATSAAMPTFHRERPQEDTRTTVMLKNLPNDYTREWLLELMDEHGFKERYDFVYLPLDFKRWAGLGYAFVNMVNHEDAKDLAARFNGFSTWRKNSQKVCEVTWGEPLQGLDAHVQRYRNSPVMHPDVPDEAKPALFSNGVRIVFPEATKRIRPPRVKK